MIDQRIAMAKERGDITEETKVPEVRLSTKDQLKKLGINISLNDRNLEDLDLSLGDNYSTTDGLDELDIDNLYSDTEDLNG